MTLSITIIRRTQEESPELKQIKLDSQRAISHLETEILVEIGNFQFRMVFPDRSGYEARWERHWSTYLATYGYQGEQVETFALSEGSTIASKSWEQRYRIYTTLGHGAFGTVYRVVSRKVGDHYAIKTFHERDHLGELNLKLLQSLNHDNIVQFYEVCQNPPSLIMELRKPENIMVHRRSPIKLKLVDFGLATEKAGTLHSFGGTLRYMAPEMEQTKSYTKAVDVWALGVIMLELSYGLRRGSADGPHTYPERHYRHIREQSPNLLQEYITSLLRWNPRNRPSAAEAREALFARQGVTSEIWNTIVNARNANTSLHRGGQVAAPVQNSQESTARLPEVGRSVLPSGATTVANTSYKDGEREGAQNTLRPFPIQEPEGPSQAPNRETSHKSPRGQGSDFSFTDYAHEQRLAARQSRSLESPPSSPPYCPAAIAISRPALEAAQNDDNPTSHLNPEQSSVSTVDTWHRIAEQAIRDNYAPTPGGTFYRRRGSYYRDGAAGPESLASTESSSTRGVKRPAGAHPSTAMLRPVFSTTANVILDYGSLR
ncbi:kinase-like domain-containing protein [Xylaria arbuscula]|nr:kinase-like domain-containing protein [Xylaria arbuscula]